ncbi:MAG: tetratricopeptide repeat protein [Bacteroidales bacterium]|nr:tetratricopeptide repeat protein [Bacteroidales bacterium]
MKHIIFIIMLFLLRIASGQGDVTPYLKGRSLMLDNKYDSALQYIEKAFAEKPGNTEIAFQRGVCHFKLKQYDHAIADFLFVNNRRPGMASLMLAKTEVRLNHPEIAIKYLREHLSSYYKTAEKKILLDDDLSVLESTKAWKSLWQERSWYTPFDKGLQEALYMRSQGDYLQAINQLSELDEKGFNRSEVNQHLAEIYLQLNNQNAAEDALDKSILSDSRNTEALKLRIDLYINKGKYEDARKDCDRLLQQAPDEFEHYLVSGRIHSMLGNYSEALERVNFYLQIYPGSHRANNEKGLIHYQEGRYLDALKSFNSALKNYEGNAAYFYNRGRAYSATGTYSYAAKDFSMALDLDPKDAETWFYKGLAEIELGDADNACFSFRKALQYGKPEAAAHIRKTCKN